MPRGSSEADIACKMGVAAAAAMGAIAVALSPAGAVLVGAGVGVVAVDDAVGTMF